MTKFMINFSEPWFLLLLIPAVALTFIPYFRSAKKYRRTRNRITSMALHLVLMVLCITVLAGITFEYDIPNKENEVILLVDKSDSGDLSEEKKDEFVYEVIRSAGANFKVGVVTFGYDQVYAAELSNDTNQVYTQYLNSASPDTTATNIASAMEYAATLFERPEAGRIVLLSDGVETDGNVKSVIKAVAAEGIKVDTVHYPNEHGDEVQIISAVLPDHTIRHGESFKVTVELQSSYEGLATVNVFDDATAIGSSENVNLVKGTQAIEIDVILPVPGLHRLAFELTAEGDTLTENNSYNTYVNIEVFNQILVVESLAGESESLCKMITDKNVTVVNVGDSAKMPKTINDLRNYDEVILVNIANSDMPEGFADILYEYVYDVGGGLFTVCGNKDDGNPNDDNWEPNAYTYEDMHMGKAGPTVYQKLLPVEIVKEYTPPVAVIIVVDTSGSMYDPEGNIAYEKSKLAAAKLGVEACLDALTERDYIGLMTFEQNHNEILSLTSVANRGRDKVLSAIDDIPMNGGATIFTGALERAGSALLAMKDVDKRHIILVTDGEPNDPEEEYGVPIKRNAEAGITMSIVGIDCNSTISSVMKRILSEYALQPESNYHDVQDLDKVGTEMRKDLDADAIKGIKYGEFTVEANKPGHSVFDGVDMSALPTLDGFYGSKLKDNAEAVIKGEFVPIYAQWKPFDGKRFAKGTVGTFMCDLNGTWSESFIASASGKLIVNNIIDALLPVESIRVSDISVSMKEQNYNTQMNIFTNVPEGGDIEVKIIPTFAAGETQILYPLATDGFGRVSFETKESGVYTVEISKRDAEGNVISTYKSFKSFSYSQEYNPFLSDSDTDQAFLAKLATDGGGFVLEESDEVFEHAVKFLHKVINPRLVFIIIALVIFLLDVAARKFKWKWPHELIRDHKAKKAMK